MRQTGIVCEIHGREAIVSGERASSCGSCAGKSACSTLGAWNAKQMYLPVQNDIGAEVGDVVEIEVPDGVVLGSAFRLYGLPMLLFFAAGGIAYFIAGKVGANGDLMAALSGIGAVVAYYLSGLFSGRDKAGMEARIVHIQTQTLTSGEPGCRT